MAVGVDRTARGVVIFHGIAGAFVGAVPAAIVALIVDKPAGNSWFRDLLMGGALGGAFIGAFSCLAGILHEDFRSIKRKLTSSTSDVPHMESALPAAAPRSPVGSDTHPVPPALRGTVTQQDDLLVGGGVSRHS